MIEFLFLPVGQWAYIPVAEPENNAGVPAVAATGIITKQEGVNTAAAVLPIPAPGIEWVTATETVDGAMPETITTLHRKEKAKRLFTGPLPQFHRRITVPSPKDDRSYPAFTLPLLYCNYAVTTLYRSAKRGDEGASGGFTG